MLKNKINFYLIEYAIGSILRQKSQSFFISFVFIFLIFLITSVFLISNSIKLELNLTLDALPQLTVQKIKAGRVYDIDTKVADDILEISGVSDAIPRVWGYYYFENAKVNFTVLGLSGFENQYKKSFQNIADDLIELENLEKSSMIIGIGVKNILKQNYYDKYFNFIKPNGKLKKVFIAGVFSGDTQLESNDTIILPQELAYEIFDMEQNKATDIVVKVPNPNEINTVIEKIKTKYPNTRIITKDDLKLSYENIFNYKGGIFLTIFIISLFTFFMIIYEKMSGLSSSQKKEVGILKAVGWSIDDIIKMKFYEGFIISFFSYLMGILGAYIFVYIFQAPLLRDIFEGFCKLKTTFELPFVFDIQTLFLIFFITIPIYISAMIIPTWKISTLQADEVIR